VALGFAAAAAGALFVAAAVTLGFAPAAGTGLFIVAVVTRALVPAALSLATPWGAAGKQEKVASKFLRSDAHASIMPAAAVA
jgi:hypothetical protein